MKIGIIGAGFTGMSAAYDLSKAGHDVVIFEKSAKPGGLAGGFRANNWDWSLENHYHHWFSNDNDILNLAKEIRHQVDFYRPKTSVLYEDSIYQFDSATSLLKFKHLPIGGRLRTGLTIAKLKSTNDWKSLENVTAYDYLKDKMGEASWKKIWKPLFVGKFGDYYKDIPASWFWSRIKKRTASLGYPVMGFETFAESLAEKISEEGGKFLYKYGVDKIETIKGRLVLYLSNKSNFDFDKVICTLPTGIFIKSVPELPADYVASIKPLKGLGAVTMILSLKKKFFDDGTYWLNVNDVNYPFLALVEHTNLVEKKHYGGENIMYIGNYLKPDHKYFTMEDDDLLKIFIPYLKKINSNFSKDWINERYVFKSKFAQPIVPLNYSNSVPSLVTPVKNLYLANMQQVYPWDRGTNYAVELGRRVSDMIIKIK